MTDAAIVAWAVRLHSNWIEHSPVTYREAVELVRIVVATCRQSGYSEQVVKREAALALLRMLELAGPSLDSYHARSR